MNFSPIWFSCSFCKKAFQDKTDLIRHRRQVHAQQLEVARKKRQLFCETKNSSGSSSSSSENEEEDDHGDDEDGGKIFMGKEAVGLDKKMEDRDGLTNNSVTFWMMESDTTEIIYLTDDDDDDHPEEPMTEEDEQKRQQFDSQFYNDCETLEEEEEEGPNNFGEKQVNFDCLEENSMESDNLVDSQCQPVESPDLDENKEEMEPSNQNSSPPPSPPDPIPDDGQNEQFDPNQSTQKEDRDDAKKLGPSRRVTDLSKICPAIKEPEPPACKLVTKVKRTRRRQEKDKIFQCPFCSKGFVWQKSLTLHQRTVHGEKNFQKSFSSSSSSHPPLLSAPVTMQDQNLSRELPTNSRQEGGCRWSSSSLIQLLNEPPQNFQQEEQQTQEDVEVEELRTVFCQICNENFLSTDRLTEHLQVCEVNRNLAMIALQMQIQQQFSYWSTPLPWAFLGPPPPPPLSVPPLLSEMTQQIHSGLSPTDSHEDPYKFVESEGKKEDKPFACKVCERKFAKKWGLSAHEKVHTRPHTCTICSRSFAKGYNLKMHYQWHAKGSKDKMCKCTYCPQLYGDTGSLFRHQKLHHAVDQGEAQDGRDQSSSSIENKKDDDPNFDPTIYKCPKCPKFFVKQTSFNEHWLGHGTETGTEAGVSLWDSSLWPLSHSSKNLQNDRMTGSVVWENDNFRLKS